MLKDYVYGIDSRAKDVHNHKFGLKGGQSFTENLGTFETNKNIFNPVFDGTMDTRVSGPKAPQDSNAYGAKKTLSAKF